MHNHALQLFNITVEVTRVMKQGTHRATLKGCERQHGEGRTCERSNYEKVNERKNGKKMEGGSLGGVGGGTVVGRLELYEHM